MSGAPLFRGSGVALVTPFDDAGVNARALAALTRFQLTEGTDALIVCGSTGEAATMTPEEQARAVEVVAGEAAGEVPVVAGCGGSDTAAVARLARGARAAGADALLLSAPPYNKPPQRGLVAHFRAVMDAGDLPAILYNVPGRTAVGLAPETVAELAEDDRVIGVKEACGDLSQIADLAALVRDRIPIWSGNDDQVLPILSLGGLGVISVLGNVAPGDTSRMVHAYLDGDTATATDLQLRYLPLIRALFAVSNPIPVKTLTGWLGFEVGPVRLPLVPLTEAEREDLIATARSAGLESGR
ncbi:MAG: 4-hydroxy-tetrahydrodipicolinate synthase [Gemmatimonadetes bacterium]|nr:4-hydroxy-tetrahydrodipicolinate synthase [Gemmatimonadota bacterium]NIQ52285.1 4-hydroxy-tetrahydrodipicolinate synthase [Gemmatimonadota bacterium]NIU72386.1 4-hydroxy-tetrahydrodipicolinate synthase [Gammaproteobacteria bacterium]NIX42865.1 4-hydroxy-tetrahydrodipicolinate synthase [Gemmatimonadota bacterium]NIY07042.1 4-hydroxy-tetrahydrodipicolinate synthase [Gemmatimonadota bacterium]